MITQVALARYHEQDCLISKHWQQLSYLALKSYKTALVTINSYLKIISFFLQKNDAISVLYKHDKFHKIWFKIEPSKEKYRQLLTVLSVRVEPRRVRYQDSTAEDLNKERPGQWAATVQKSEPFD